MDDLTLAALGAGGHLEAKSTSGKNEYRFEAAKISRSLNYFQGQLASKIMTRKAFRALTDD